MIEILLKGGACVGCVYITYVIITKLFAYLDKRLEIEKVTSKKVNEVMFQGTSKLCDKIDLLVDAIYNSNKCTSETNLITTNQFKNIESGQDKIYSLVQRIYEIVVKEGDKHE